MLFDKKAAKIEYSVKGTVMSRELLTLSVRRMGGSENDKLLEKVLLCDYPQEKTLTFYKCKHEHVRRFWWC